MTTSEEIKYSIVIPCFNEKDNIPLLLKKFSECLADFEQKYASESGKLTLFFENGSTDGTLDLLNSITRQYNFCSLHLKKSRIWRGIKSVWAMLGYILVGLMPTCKRIRQMYLKHLKSVINILNLRCYLLKGVVVNEKF